ncbi:hypothetical protein BV22DRAFT_1016358 [Leucogyrophana mollusca]|uniref:Uncharacterized protein n=1 Tax=Leucogyrophana mollusca TaxID=85980 RepID=A0ACB8BCB5_9AGAM|nr:hypothetical protein BV22DRAFT_1016358 [Leucogyrophana mollusca]
MNIAINNISSVLGSDDPQVFTRLLNKLLEPNQDPVFLASYTCAILLEIRNGHTQREGGFGGYSPFGQRCADAGIVKAMLALATQSPYTPVGQKERYIAQYQALAVVTDLMLSGDLAQRRALLDQMLKYDIVGICLRKLDHQLCIHRHQAVITLKVLSTESFLGEKVSSATAAEIIVSMCKFALEGPKAYVDGLSAQDTAYQLDVFIGKPRNPRIPVGSCASRYYGISQQDALWAAHGLLCTSPPPSRKFCYEVVKKNPVVLDLLFDCAIIPRPESYPETRVDSLACEVLSMLFQWPSHIVPGVSTNMDGAFKAQDWKSMSQTFKLLVDREEWAEKMIEVWMKTEEDDWPEIKRLFEGVKKFVDFNAPDEHVFDRVIESRGVSRIAVLRLIASLSHAVEPCGVSNTAIESLLRVGYQGSHKIRDQTSPQSESDKYTRIMRTKMIFNSPKFTPNPTAADASEHIAEEGVLGPIALANLLVVLARRTGLDAIQGLRKAPNGLSTSTCLDHVQQITHPEVVRRFLKIALQRVKAQADKGRTQVKEGMLHRARVEFTSAAELAAALVAFDNHTKGQYAEEVKGARKELVLALGNASEMAMRSKQYQKALSFGLGAVSVAETIPANEELDPGVILKNKRRVDQARVALA